MLANTWMYVRKPSQNLIITKKNKEFRNERWFLMDKTVSFKHVVIEIIKSRVHVWYLKKNWLV